MREKVSVEAYSGRGTFITDGTTQAVRQSLDLMVKIGLDRKARRISPGGGERSSSRRLRPWLAVTRIQEPSELATMRDAVAVMDKAGQDPDAYIEADLDFHLALLAEGAANARSSCRYLIPLSDYCGNSGCASSGVPEVRSAAKFITSGFWMLVEHHDLRKGREAEYASRPDLGQVRDDSHAALAKRSPGKNSPR